MFEVLAQMYYGPSHGSAGGVSGLWMYLAALLVPLALGLWAQMRVKSAFSRGSQVEATSGISGAEVAKMILDSHEIRGVKIEPVNGFLTDHYDSQHKVLRLSPQVYSGHSVAALGIAAHEAGHAIQDATRYGPLVLRNGIVPLAKIGGAVSSTVLGFGLFFALALSPVLGKMMLLAGIIGLGLVVLFQLINLPVELDASRRAKDLLKSTNIIAPGRESALMGSVLNAAAWTYVAATVGTIVTLLYYLMIFLSAQRRN